MKINTDMKIEWVMTDSIKPHPKNNNKHPADQIERLAKILKYQGQRTPLVVSRLSGYVVKGCGTLEAIKFNNVESVAVTYQDFDDTTQEILYMTSDNSIAEWSEIDLSAVKVELPNLGEFDYDLLGFKSFEIEPLEFDEPSEKKTPEEKEAELKTCPNCGVMIDE